MMHNEIFTKDLARRARIAQLTESIAAIKSSLSISDGSKKSIINMALAEMAQLRNKS